MSHIMLTCAFTPGCLMTLTWLHAPDCTVPTGNTNVRCWWYTGEAYLVGRQSDLQQVAHAFQGLHGSTLQACPALPAHA